MCKGEARVPSQYATDWRLKLQLSVDIEDLCDLASNKQEELMVEGTDCRQAEEMKWWAKEWEELRGGYQKFIQSS